MRRLPLYYKAKRLQTSRRLPIISWSANARISRLLCEDKMSLELISLLLRLTLLCLNAGSRQEKAQILSAKGEVYYMALKIMK